MNSAIPLICNDIRDDCNKYCKQLNPKNYEGEIREGYTFTCAHTNRKVTLIEHKDKFPNDKPWHKEML